MWPWRAADHSPLLVPRSWKSRAIPLPTLWATPGLQRDHFLLYLVLTHFSVQFLDEVPDVSYFFGTFRDKTKEITAYEFQNGKI